MVSYPDLPPGSLLFFISLFSLPSASVCSVLIPPKHTSLAALKTGELVIFSFLFFSSFSFLAPFPCVDNGVCIMLLVDDITGHGQRPIRSLLFFACFPLLYNLNFLPEPIVAA